MKRKNLLAGIAAVIGLILLLTNEDSALSGAIEGIGLCIKTVIPALLPFLFLSATLVTSFQGSEFPVLKRIGEIFHMPVGTYTLLIPAFLGGYPAGAQNIELLYEQGTISKQEAERLLAFCSNAGPSFLFGLLVSKFASKLDIWLIWLVQLLAAYTASCIFQIPSSRIDSESRIVTEKSSAFDASMMAIEKICGWIILFRTVLAILDRYVGRYIPGSYRPIFAGLLELTNGCCMLEQIKDETFRFVACSCLLSFGGLCVIGQTAAVCPKLDLRYYVLGKLVQTASALLFSAAIRLGFWYIIPVCMILMQQIPCRIRKWDQKKSGNPEACVI